MIRQRVVVSNNVVYASILLLLLLCNLFPAETCSARDFEHPALAERSKPHEHPKLAEHSDGLRLESSAFADGGQFPQRYTTAGAGISPPLSWSGAPPATHAYALSMHQIERDGKTKWYWILYNIPTSIHQLPENVRGVGTAGTNSIKQIFGYAPPHPSGMRAENYVITLYALSSPISKSVPPNMVDYFMLKNLIQGKVIGCSRLHAHYAN